MKKSTESNDEIPLSERPLGYYKKAGEVAVCDVCGRGDIKEKAKHTKLRGLYLYRKGGKEKFACYSCAVHRVGVI